MQILVVGGGIQGLAVAAALARDGHLVQLLERERPGCRASWVAAGLLTPSSPWRYPRALIDLCHRSEAMFPDFVADLAEHTGHDAEYEVGGMLYPEGAAFGAAEVAEHSALRNGLGFDTVRLDHAQLSALQSGLGPQVQGAAWQPRSARVRPPRLLAGLVARAGQLGVHLVSGCEVVRLLGRRGRVTGVQVASGQQLEAEVVVLAAGAWSAPLAATLGLAIDVRPVRGQILLLRGPPGLLGPVVNDGDTYLVPRRDGRLLVGSTMEDAGFDEVTTPQALRRLRRRAADLLPATARMEVETDWAGLRPGTADRMPYIGAVPEIDGLLLATGHFRNGILLAPVTAQLVAELVAERRTSVDLQPFAPRAIDPTLALLPS